MKKIVLPKEQETVPIESLKHNSLIGFYGGVKKTKGFILLNGIGRYYLVTKDNLSVISEFYAYNSIEHVISTYKGDYYLFDNVDELFKWLAE